MLYTMLLKPHANIRYRQSLQTLAKTELQCILNSINVTADVRLSTLAGKEWLTFECDPLPEDMLREVARNAGCCLLAEQNGDWIRPLCLEETDYYPQELPQLLKYKGKTNADFTFLLLHAAKAASAYQNHPQPLTVLDPMCGKGTSLFCALVEGHNAIGTDVDAKALGEADVYFARSLKTHHFKHKREEASLTVEKGKSMREVRYNFSNDPENWKAGDKRTLRLIGGDLAKLPKALGKAFCHIAIADLPYGVQHAPSDGSKTVPLAKLADKTAAVLYSALKPGGAAALSFNTYTLKRQQVVDALEANGLHPLVDPPYDGFEHWVEQAVNRDAVIAIKKS